MDMIDLLSIIGLPFRATSIQKLEATLSEQQKDKMADGSGFPSPLPPSQHCYQTSDFWGKGVVAYISRKILGGSFHIKIMLEEKNNIVWTPNSKLLLNLMIRAKKLSELNPI